MSNISTEKAREMSPTKLKILKAATSLFFREGYTNTTARKLADEVGISTGNLTFHFPTKEHLLLEMTRAFCKYQWEMTLNYPKYKVSPLLAYALEIAVQTAVCDKNEIARDFYISAYTQPMTLAEIRDWDYKKAQMLFKNHNPDWNEVNFKEAENIASGIELSAMMVDFDENFPLENRVISVLDALMKLYNIPFEERADTLNKIQQIDYIEMANDVLPKFSQYIEQNIA